MPLLGFLLADDFGDDGSAAEPMNNIGLVLTIIGLAVQALESALQQVLWQRTIETAIGVQLDAIGKVVGEIRAGADDDTYRRRVRARISVHRSNGTVENILRVARMVLFNENATIRVEPQPVASVIVHIDDVIVSDALADTVLFGFLQSTVAAGVRVILHTRRMAPELVFRFDGAGPGLDEGFFSDTRG